MLELSKTKAPMVAKGEREVDSIGRFLLELYHRQVISLRDDWIVSKALLRSEFHKFLGRSENSQISEKYKQPPNNAIGTILKRTNYLINTPPECNHYRIKDSTLFQYRIERLKQWEECRIDKTQMTNGSLDTTRTEHTVTLGLVDVDPALKNGFNVDENAISYPLEYQGTRLRHCKKDFRLTNMGCIACELNFETPAEFEDHVKWHGDDSDFESLKDMKKRMKPFFKISYKDCQNSHYFCFSLETDEKHVVIEKLILVQSRSMFYVKNSQMPYAMPSDGRDTFFLDSHLFTIFIEQPLIVVFSYESNPEFRIVEQHHFMRTTDFPKVNFNFSHSHRLSNKKLFKPTVKLNQFMPDANLKSIILNSSNQDLAEASDEFRQYLENNKEFTLHNMTAVLRILLQIEDLDSIQKYICLVQNNVRLRKVGDEYSIMLKTDGKKFIENILQRYDEVFIFPAASQEKSEVSFDILLDDNTAKGKSKKKVFYGIVERVSGNRVVFLCDRKLSDTDLYTLIFRPTRLVMRYQYRALQSLDLISKKERTRLLFPALNTDKSLSNAELDLFNKKIAENIEQYQTVRNISSGPNKQAPYIIFGPPGTGKTTTVVESILQLYQNRPTTKILVMAGSNSACDEITSHLCKVLTIATIDPHTIVRIYSKSNEKRLDNIDDMLLEYSNMYGAHFYPDIELLHQYRIVVCTLSTVGKLALGKFGVDGVFTHIFIDEVAACTETEALLGIANTVSANAHLIISGDPRQLGPILKSDRARDLGLGRSLMERLMQQHECYRVDEATGDYDRSIQMRLIRNHRSHPEIVNLYNKLYYNGELLPIVNAEDVSLGSKWHRSPNPLFPIMFHSVFGNSTRDKNSVSLYNDKELEVVMEYVKDLMCFGINGEPVEQSDIGIISPYKKQYLRIQEELNLLNLFEIETGSVETFQGKEKNIIIVSFVRSFSPTLGFLSDPQRLNVTLSRPKALLILIGNPKTLYMNADFKYVIDMCHERKTMVGTIFHEYRSLQLVAGDAVSVDLTQSITNLTIQNKALRSNKQRYNNSKSIKNRQQQPKQNAATSNAPKLGKKMKNQATPHKAQQTLRRFPTELDLIFESLPPVPKKCEEIIFDPETLQRQADTSKMSTCRSPAVPTPVSATSRGLPKSPPGRPDELAPVAVSWSRGTKPVVPTYNSSGSSTSRANPIHKPNLQFAMAEKPLFFNKTNTKKKSNCIIT